MPSAITTWACAVPEAPSSSVTRRPTGGYYDGPAPMMSDYAVGGALTSMSMACAMDEKKKNNENVSSVTIFILRTSDKRRYT